MDPMSFDKELEEWELFHQPLRKDNAELFKQMLEEVSEHKKELLIYRWDP